MHDATVANGFSLITRNIATADRAFDFRQVGDEVVTMTDALEVWPLRGPHPVVSEAGIS
jgi:hypothetical protein